MGSTSETSKKVAMMILEYVTMCLLLAATSVSSTCSEDDAVDSGGGPGSCIDNCDCPTCAPFCSHSGYCQPTPKYGSHPYPCTEVTVGGGCSYCAAPLYVTRIGARRNCPCGAGGKCGRRCCRPCF